jgi:outer membrane murein-binding lipoprotein Lpp
MKGLLIMSSVKPRRASDEDGSAALNRKAQGAWDVLVLIATILVGAGAVSGATYGLAGVAAEEKVAPVRTEIRDHKADLAGKRVAMDMTVEALKEAISRVDRRLDMIDHRLVAVCRASTHPEACLKE